MIRMRGERGERERERDRVGESGGEREKNYATLCMFRLTRELLMLIERESNFMMRGIMKNNMDALRNRIQTSFLQVNETRTLNPKPITEESRRVWGNTSSPSFLSLRRG